jgi:hypothetical protein
MMDAVEKTQEISKTQRTVSALIVPLPGETRKSHLAGLKTLIDLDIDYICPFTLMLLEGTEIASPEQRKQYDMVSKFRVIPNYYGKFQEVYTVECEEVCVGTNTMAFEEYVDVRGAHFFLGSYHADDNMLEFRRYLRNFEISAFDWMLRMKETIHRAPMGVREVYDEFLQATRDELWDSAEALRDFWNLPENRDRFINGELGDNLFFKFRARAVTKWFRELVDYGALVAEEMVLERAPELKAEEIRRELREVAEYLYLKRKFVAKTEEIAATVVRPFSYDFVAWEGGRYARPLRAPRSESPVLIKFFYTAYQQEKLDVAYKTHGTSPQGIGMLLRKHNPLFFVRETAYADSVTLNRETPPLHREVFVHPGAA